MKSPDGPSVETAAVFIGCEHVQGLPTNREIDAMADLGCRIPGQPGDRRSASGQREVGERFVTEVLGHVQRDRRERHAVALH